MPQRPREPTTLPAKHDPHDAPCYVTGGLLKWRSYTDWPFMVVALGSLPILLLELDKGDLPPVDRAFIAVVNITVLVTFAVDYFVEFYLASNRKAYVRGELLGLLLLVSQGLALAPFLAGLGVLRALRAIRALRFIAVAGRVLAVGGVASRDGKRLIREHAAGIALGLAGLTLVTSAAGFTIAEDVGVGGRVHSFFDALWWSLSTITTVGYGDVYPVTAIGRVIGGFTMIVGVSTFALVTAKIAQFLVRTDDEPELQQAEPVVAATTPLDGA